MTDDISSPAKLKEILSGFKFVSPVKRPPRSPKPIVKQDPDTSPVLNLVAQKEIEPASLLNTPSTPRKRKFKQELDIGSPRSAKKSKRGYAPPEQYAHLNLLQDHLQEHLDIMFCGVNPGCMSAEVGHHFASPTNHFWKCLHRSGLTDRLLAPSEDLTLPEAYNLGLTNLVDRPSAEQAELSKQDMISGVPILLNKIRRFRPCIVTFVGKGIWEIFIKESPKLVQTVESATLSSGFDAPLPDVNKLSSKLTSKSKGKAKRKTKTTFEWGIQPFKVLHEDSDQVKQTLFFVMPSTSGRVVSHQLNDKIVLFTALRERLMEVKNASLQTSDMSIILAPPYKQ